MCYQDDWLGGGPLVCKHVQQVLTTWPFVCPMYCQYGWLGGGSLVCENVQQSVGCVCSCKKIQL